MPTTYLGGTGTDAVSSVQIDSANNIYIAGRTDSPDFPTTAGSFEPVPVIPLWNNLGPGGFAARISADGGKLVWSTYVMSADHPLSGDAGVSFLGAARLAVTASGDAYIAGVASPGYPVTQSAPQICYDGQQSPRTYFGSGSADAFVVHLDSHGALVDATYAGRGVLYTLGLSVTASGAVLLSSNDTALPNSSVRSEIQFAGAGQTARAGLSPTVLNSATMSTIPYSTSGPAVLPGELVTLTGFGIGPDVGITNYGPLTLGGVQVLFDGQPAPLLYVQSRQINVQAAVELSGRVGTTITVIYNQATVGTINVGIANYGFPGIFRLHPGQSTDAAAVNVDGTINSPSNPAARGSAVAVWGTGFGLTDPACSTGGANIPGPVNLAAGLSVAITAPAPVGQPIQSTPVLYAGGSPGLPCGVDQINFQVPTGIAPGAYTFIASSLIAFPAGSNSGVAGTSSARIWVK